MLCYIIKYIVSFEICFFIISQQHRDFQHIIIKPILKKCIGPHRILHRLPQFIGAALAGACQRR